NESDATMAFLPGAKGGEPASEVRVTLGQGGTIHGRLSGAPHFSRAYVEARRGVLTIWGTKVEHDGAFEVRGLTDGEWTLGAEVEVDEKRLTGSVAARAGDTVTVELTPSGSR